MSATTATRVCPSFRDLVNPGYGTLGPLGMQEDGRRCGEVNRQRNSNEINYSCTALIYMSQHETRFSYHTTTPLPSAEANDRTFFVEIDLRVSKTHRRSQCVTVSLRCCPPHALTKVLNTTQYNQLASCLDNAPLLDHCQDRTEEQDIMPNASETRS